MNLYPYVVQVVPVPAAMMGGPFAVIVTRLESDRARVVASTTGCRDLARAEDVACAYRAQFGVAP